MILGKDQQWFIRLNRTKIERSDELVLLAVTFGDELKLKKHMENICQAAKYGLLAFQRVRKYLNAEKAKVLVIRFYQ